MISVIYDNMELAKCEILGTSLHPRQVGKKTPLKLKTTICFSLVLVLVLSRQSHSEMSSKTVPISKKLRVYLGSLQFLMGSSINPNQLNRN